LFGIKKLGLMYNHQFHIETQKSHLSWCALHGQYADSQRKSSVFHNRKQRDTTSRTGQRAIQLAGSAVKGSLDLDLVFLFLSSFSTMAAWSLSR